MNLKILLTVYAVYMVSIGVQNLVAPSLVSSLTGMAPPGSFALMRSWGVVVLGVGVMCGIARTAEASKARDALILGVIVINALNAVIAALPLLGGGSLLMWADTALWALFAVLFIVAVATGKSAPKPVALRSE